MSERTLKRLVGALVVLVAVWGVTALLSSDRSRSRGAAGAAAEFFDGVDREHVTAVRISSVSGDVELTRDGDRWLVNGLATDSGTVARFWDMMESAKITDLIATNPANHERMEITDSAAWRLEVELDGGETRTLLVGGQGPRFATSYVRLPGEDAVYLLQGDIRVHMRRRLDDWRNKRLAAVDTAQVARIEVERDGEAYVVVRADSAWTFEGGDTVDASAVEALLMDMRDLRASAILAETDSLAQTPPGGSLRLLDAEGAVLAEITIGQGERDRWARSAGDETVYRLPSFRIDRIFPTRERMSRKEEEG